VRRTYLVLATPLGHWCLGKLRAQRMSWLAPRTGSSLQDTSLVQRDRSLLGHKLRERHKWSLVRRRGSVAHRTPAEGKCQAMAKTRCHLGLEPRRCPQELEQKHCQRGLEQTRYRQLAAQQSVSSRGLRMSQERHMSSRGQHTLRLALHTGSSPQDSSLVQSTSERHTWSLVRRKGSAVRRT